ncbi:tyrosyl-tRNA synthetase [Escherichia coli]|uniref:Tyrosyl-tRNA synthetase n=1 Tax=Escherichia coli TaxID=562 RepID=A0A376S8V1_ECOLX|nr:tyrosyl-tRNA synthetase [Escherichia coli]
MSIEEINALEEEDKNSGKAPRAQYVLAEQVTRLVHGEEGCRRQNVLPNACSAVP